MPHQTTTAARQAIRRSAIVYEDARGKTFTGTVTAAGSSSGVKIKLAGGGRGAGSSVVDNVGNATATHGANSATKYHYI